MSEVMTGVFIMWHIAFPCALGLDCSCLLIQYCPSYSELPDIRKKKTNKKKLSSISDMKDVL